MRNLIIVTSLLGAGCPAPRHALSIEVRSGGRPVASAVVALVCPPGGSGQLTDERGQAVFKLAAEQPLDRCRLVAGKVGFETVEARPTGRACAEQGRQGPSEKPECPAVGLELVELAKGGPGAMSTPGSPVARAAFPTVSVSHFSARTSALTSALTFSLTSSLTSSLASTPSSPSSSPVSSPSSSLASSPSSSPSSSPASSLSSSPASSRSSTLPSSLAAPAQVAP